MTPVEMLYGFSPVIEAMIQAQEAVTLAEDQYISALYGFNIAKALLARSVGSGPEDVERFLSGK